MGSNGGISQTRRNPDGNESPSVPPNLRYSSVYSCLELFFGESRLKITRKIGNLQKLTIDNIHLFFIFKKNKLTWVQNTLVTENTLLKVRKRMSIVCPIYVIYEKQINWVKKHFKLNWQLLTKESRKK